MEDLSSDLDSEKTMNTALNNVITSMWDSLRKYEKSYRELKTENEGNQSKLQELKKGVQVKENEYRKAVADRSELLAEIAMYKDTLSQSDQVKKQLDSSTSELIQLKRHNAQLKEESGIVQDQLQVLQGNLASIDSMYITYKKVYSSMLKNVLDIIELPETEEDIIKVSEKLLDIYAEKSLAKTDNSEEIFVLQAEIFALKSKLTNNVSKDEEILELRKSVEIAMYERNKLQKMIDDSSYKSDAVIRIPIDEKDAEIKDLHLQIEVNVNQIENLKNQLKDAEKDLDDQKTTIQGLREQLITLKELSPEANMRRSTLESSLEKYRQETLQKDIRIKELNVEILEKEDQIDFLKSSLQSIDTELLMSLQSENTSLKKERESLASSLEAVTKKLDKISKQSSK
jgi:chromosome segregation ATPase